MVYLPHTIGQGLVEYALILVMVALFVIATLVFLDPIMEHVFEVVIENLN